MIKANSISALQETLSKARIKAHLINPETIKAEDNYYKVKGSKGNFYDVFLGVNPEGEFWIACLCRAGLEGLNCYHASKALDVHLEDLFKAKLEPNEIPYLKESSTKPIEKVGNIRI